MATELTREDFGGDFLIIIYEKSIMIKSFSRDNISGDTLVNMTLKNYMLDLNEDVKMLYNRLKLKKILRK